MSLRLEARGSGDRVLPAAEHTVAARAPAATAGQGTVVGAYRLLDALGRGSGGVVYRARPIAASHADRDYAVRLLEVADRAAAQRRIHAQHEAGQIEALLALEHPNVVRIQAIGAGDESLFTAMEYVHGVSLRVLQRRSADEPPPVTVALHVVGQILAGLCAVHDIRDTRGSLWPGAHGAVCPESIFLGFCGEVKLGDLDKVVVRDAAASPAARGAAEPQAAVAVSASADVQALGLILHELVTAGSDSARSPTHRPLALRDDVVSDLRREHGDEGPALLQSVLARVLAIAPQQRLSSAPALLAALSPLLPKTRGMELAVAELTRCRCLDAFKEDLRAGGGLPQEPCQGIVAVCIDDERLQQSVAEMLLDSGHWVELHSHAGSLRDSVKYRLPPVAVLLDLTSDAFVAGQLVEQMSTARSLMPVVAIAKEGLTAAAVQGAHAVGAIDLLTAPLTKDRISLAVALAACGEAGRHSWSAPQAGLDLGASRVLVVTADEPLARRIAGPLHEWGFSLEVAHSREAALQRFDSASFEAVVIDASADPAQADELTAQMRQLPGIGVLPVLCLTSHEPAHNPTQVKRVVFRQASDEPVVLAMALRALIASAHTGRSHTRFDAVLAVELLHGGEVFAAQTENVSRSGLALRCAHPLRTGDAVRLALQLPQTTESIAAHGIVTAVHASAGSTLEVLLGVQLYGFVDEGATSWIRFITSLHRGRGGAPVPLGR